MNEKQLLDSLFKAAREESPRAPFTEVADQFKSSVVVEPTNLEMPHIGNKHFFNLKNTLILMIGHSVFLILLTVGLSNKQENSASIHELQTILEDSTQANEDRLISSQEDIDSTIYQIPTLHAPQDRKAINNDYPTEKKERIVENILPKDSPKVDSIISKKRNTISFPKSQETAPKKEPGIQESDLVPLEDFSIIKQQNEASFDKILPSQKEVLLTIHNNDTKEDIEQFINQLNSYNLSDKIANFNFTKGLVDRFKLHLTHQQGLSLKVQARGFEKFHVKLILDQQGQLEGLAFRINDESKFSSIYNLTEKVKYRYVHDES